MTAYELSDENYFVKRIRIADYHKWLWYRNSISLKLVIFVADDETGFAEFYFYGASVIHFQSNFPSQFSLEHSKFGFGSIEKNDELGQIVLNVINS